MELEAQEKTAKANEALGANPCDRVALRDEEGTTLLIACDSPRCPDCGPRKFNQLWAGMETHFGGQVDLYAVGSDLEYRQMRDAIRQQSVSHGQKYEYVSWRMPDGSRVVATDAKLRRASTRTQLAALKAGLKQAYLTGWAAIRKTWTLAKLTLSRERVRESVSIVGKLRYIRVRSTRQQVLNAQKSEQYWKESANEYTTEPR